MPSEANLLPNPPSRVPIPIRRRIRPIRLRDIQILQPRQMRRPFFPRRLVDRRRTSDILVRQSLGLFTFGLPTGVRTLHVDLRCAALRKTVGCFPAPIVRPNRAVMSDVSRHPVAPFKRRQLQRIQIMVRQPEALDAVQQRGGPLVRPFGLFRKHQQLAEITAPVE